MIEIKRYNTILTLTIAADKIMIDVFNDLALPLYKHNLSLFI